MEGIAQPAVTSGLTTHAHFLTVHLVDGFSNATAKTACGQLEVLVAHIKRRFLLTEGQEVFFGLGLCPRLAKEWFGLSTFSPFTELRRGLAHIPATGGELFLHVKSDRYDACFEVLRMFAACLGKNNIRRMKETHGFLFKKGPNGLGRDLTGFEDGTENPRGVNERLEAAVVQGQGAASGGSFVLAQKWRHNLSLFESMTTGEQELIFGRTREDSTELPETQRPHSHITKVQVEDDRGEEMEIVRHSLSYGNVARESMGLYFLAYSSSPAKFQRMLASMVGHGDGDHDRLFAISKCVESNWYYVPSLAQLRNLRVAASL